MHQELGPEMHNHHRKLSSRPRLPVRKRRHLAPGFNKEPLLQTLPLCPNSHEILGFFNPKGNLPGTLPFELQSLYFLEALLIKMLFGGWGGTTHLLLKMPKLKCLFPKKRLQVEKPTGNLFLPATQNINFSVAFQVRQSKCSFSPSGVLLTQALGDSFHSISTSSLPAALSSVLFEYSPFYCLYLGKSLFQGGYLWFP